MNFIAPRHSKMSIRDLKNLVKTGEGTYLEFKRTIPSPAKIAREITALANTHGGTLLVGVDDDKSLVGVSSYHEQLFLFNQAAYELCTPAVEFDLEILPYNYRDILIIRIFEAKKKPIVVQWGKKEVVFVRIKDKSVRASIEQVSIMRHQSTGEGASFVYGPNEQKLFRYLTQYERITVKEFSNLINVNRKKASNILVNLVNAGILELFNTGKIDYFIMAHNMSS
ncbi:MAG TPA: ATP-binding protein [Balneolales bacterium]|nr:ATP-binding protein [Balneolales bacterium]